MKAMTSKKDASFHQEIIITGFGGQGIVLAGQILGKAASLVDERESSLTQSYGPEARGGACSAQVIVSSKTIHYPYVRHPDIVVAMSQEGFDKNHRMLREDGILIIDQDLIRHAELDVKHFYAIPATRMAEELGNKMMANVVMLGFFTAVTGIISTDGVRDMVAAAVPKSTIDLNVSAFNKGYDHGQAVLKGRQKKAAGHRGATS
jgi:2-oxoglutarate ferredoxin oxidoreductase subunit gamma